MAVALMKFQLKLSGPTRWEAICIVKTHRSFHNGCAILPNLHVGYGVNTEFDRHESVGNV